MFESVDQAVKPEGTQLESQLDVSEVSEGSDCVERNSPTTLVRVEPLPTEAIIEITIKTIETPKNHLAISLDCLTRLSAGINASWLGGLSGGGNQLRQPYLRKKMDLPEPESMPNTDHVPHYAWYIGNYPELGSEKIAWLGAILKAI